nr:uncharacterized protein LOC128685910 [Cherax quadricarinatus]
MSGVVAAEAVRPSHNSAFSAVVTRKSFSFSVDDILASTPKDTPKTSSPVPSAAQTPPTHTLPAEDRLSAAAAAAAAAAATQDGSDDDGDADEEINVDSDPDYDTRFELRHEEEAGRRLPPPVPTLLGHLGGAGPPLQPASTSTTTSSMSPAVSWPPNLFFQHHLALRAFSREMQLLVLLRQPLL